MERGIRKILTFLEVLHEIVIEIVNILLSTPLRAFQG